MSCIYRCSMRFLSLSLLPGFWGLNCEINYDECVHGYCANNSTCIDLVADYQCICPSGFAGELSEASHDEEEIDECSSSFINCSVTAAD